MAFSDPLDVPPPRADESARLRALVEQICAGTIELARVNASLIRQRAAVMQIALDHVARCGSRVSRERELPVRSVALEIAAATQTHDLTVQKELGEAHTLTEKFAATVDALESGRISMRHAQAVLDTGIVIDDDDTRRGWEQVVLTRAERDSPGRTRAFARELAESVQPVGMTARHARAAAERGVSVRDLADGMAELSVVLPATVAYGIRDRLRRQAAAIRAAAGRGDAPMVTVGDDDEGQRLTSSGAAGAAGAAGPAGEAPTLTAGDDDARQRLTSSGAAGAAGPAGDAPTPTAGDDDAGYPLASGRAAGAATPAALTAPAASDAADWKSAATPDEAMDTDAVVVDPVAASAASAATTRAGAAAGQDANGQSPDLRGVASDTSEGELAGAPRAVRDERTLTQIGADLCADLLLTAAPTIDPTDDVTCPGGLGAIRAQVQITVPVLTLLGRTDAGAAVAGRSPIDPATARRLAARAPGWDRVLCDPVVGTVLEVDRYSPTAAQRRYLAARDQHCRAPGCRAPLARCQIDHNHEAQNGGATTLSNLAHLCVRHHTLKTETAWTVSQEPDGTLRFESPLGQRFEESPPPRVLFTHDPDDVHDSHAAPPPARPPF